MAIAQYYPQSGLSFQIPTFTIHILVVRQWSLHFVFIQSQPKIKLGKFFITKRGKVLIEDQKEIF